MIQVLVKNAKALEVFEFSCDKWLDGDDGVLSRYLEEPSTYKGTVKAAELK